ncbi:hypothetical protein E2562_035940 [Oryza meyeriana var. granulata]|uniref:Uncharacterized protein n=1 Tax=Oryza meyeriana var. granulata TaxID=110450 RepID=A0A6G1DSL5_9ORYZ|nr:hypothetical protein E2562_035940 [Oryza meyeriana var. granulata]
MAQPAFLSSLRSCLRSPQLQAPAPLSHLQPRRGFHVDLGAREKALLEEDVALKRFKSYKNSVKQVSKAGNVLTGVVLCACAYEIYTRALRSRRPRPAKFACRRAKNAAYDDYKFPDPIPEFAAQETSKFKEHMLWRLEQKKDDYFGEHVEEIVDVCTEILGTFLEHDYCGPGTLLVHPFLDMKGEIKERGLPGAPQAARAAIAWAEKNIDKDWKVRNPQQVAPPNLLLRRRNRHRQWHPTQACRREGGKLCSSFNGAKEDEMKPWWS